MNEEEARREAVRYWWGMAEEALQSARLDSDTELLHSAINRAYYAVFYAASAVLVERGLHFRKHTGVRSALHRELVKTGLLSVEMGSLYDRLFEDRQHGDYVVLAEFEPESVREKVESAGTFLNAVRSLITSLEADPGGSANT